MRRVALVTGASRGIGRACALRLAEDGFHIAVNYLRNEELAMEALSAVRAAGRTGMVVAADVSRESEVRDMFRCVGEELAPPVVLVNNAGIYPRQGLEEIRDEDWEKVIGTNLRGAYYCCKHALPGMKERSWGRIVNISSMLGFKGSAHGAHYAASKAGMEGLTKSIALEVSRYGITVNAVAPGAIDTDILAHDSPKKKADRIRSIPLGRLGTPEDVAGAVSFLCSEDASYITGETIHVNGGFLMV